MLQSYSGNGAPFRPFKIESVRGRQARLFYVSMFHMFPETHRPAGPAQIRQRRIFQLHFQRASGWRPAAAAVGGAREQGGDCGADGQGIAASLVC